jgi:HlyD family secretion protein
MSFSPTVIMTVADLSVMECEVMVDETDFRNLKLGQEAKIKVDALEGLELKGEVTEIGSSALVRGSGSQAATQTALGANTGNQPKDFKVTITIKDPPPNLRPGLNATADITTSKRDKVLAVPVQAVVVREVNKEGRSSTRPSGGGQERRATPSLRGREKGGEGRRLRGGGREGVFRR